MLNQIFAVKLLHVRIERVTVIKGTAYPLLDKISDSLHESHRMVGDLFHPIKILNICRIICTAKDTLEIASVHEFR